MSSFVVDTHALAWFLTDDPQLGSNAKNILELAESGKATILVPTIVLAELLYIVEKKRTSVDFERLLEILKTGKSYNVVSFTLEVLEEVQMIHTVPELHDRIIAATARLLRATVIAKDPHIRSAVDVVW